MTKDGGGKYVYDAENRISSAAGVTFTYNGDGTRVMKSDGVIDWGSGPLSRSDLGGNITRNFVFLGGKRIARRVLPANTIDYMFSDHLGSLGVMTDAAGNIEGESDYYPFGGEQVISGGLTAYKFTGKERDADGLDYFGARHYSSALGRFMSPDWSEEPEAVPYSDMEDPQTLNLYSYVRNSPSSLADPDGHVKLVDACYLACKEKALVAQAEKSFNNIIVVSRVLALVSYYTLTNLYNFSGNKTPPPPPTPTSQSTPADPNQQVPPNPDDPTKAKRVTNPKHNANSASPEPTNVQELYDNSIADKNGVRWARDSDGTIQRFSAPSNGESHWNGSTAGPKPIRENNIPIEIRRAL